MDPSLMMMLMSLAAGAAGGIGGSNAKQMSSFDKQQRGGIHDILNSIKSMKGGAQDITQNPQFQTGQNWLQSMFNDPEFFKSFEAPLQRDFQENIIPGLASRFASQGSGGSLGSTAFRNQLGREGSNLSTNIAALRGNMQQQAIPQLLGYAQQPFQNLMSMYQQALGQPINNQYRPANAGPFGNILGGLSSGAAQGYGQQWGQSMAGQYPGTM